MHEFFIIALSWFFFFSFFPPNSAYKKTMDILKYKHEMQEIFSSWCWLPGHKEQGLFVLNYLHQPKTDLQALRNATYFWTKKIWNGLCILLLFCLFFAAHEESQSSSISLKKKFFSTYLVSCNGPCVPKEKWHRKEHTIINIIIISLSPRMFHLQHWQGWNQFGTTGVFLSRYNWCAPLSHPFSCSLGNHVPSQQSCKEEYESWKWGASVRYHASHTKTMLPTRKSVPRSGR